MPDGSAQSVEGTGGVTDRDVVTDKSRAREQAPGNNKSPRLTIQLTTRTRITAVGGCAGTVTMRTARRTISNTSGGDSADVRIIPA